MIYANEICASASENVRLELDSWKKSINLALKIRRLSVIFVRPLTNSPMNDVEREKKDSEIKPFIRLLKHTALILRISGFFPIGHRILHWKNIFSFLVMIFIGSMNGYMMVVKTIPSGFSILNHWDVVVTVQFGICLYFCMSFACLVFIAIVGYFRKLESFGELMSHASNQKGLEHNFKSASRKIRIIQTITVIAAIFNFFIYLSFLTIDAITEFMPETVNILKNLFGTDLMSHLAMLVFAPLDYVVLYHSALLYWICCKCLRIEFLQVSKDIAECDLKNLSSFKEIAVRYSSLIKCLHYLHQMVALYVMIMIAFGSLISTLFLYVILLSDVDFGFRLLSAYWLVLIACMNVIVCLSADKLHKAVKEAKERVCSKIAEHSVSTDIDNQTFCTANVIAYLATVDGGITAFGYFTVTRGLLLKILTKLHEHRNLLCNMLLAAEAAVNSKKIGTFVNMLDGSMNVKDRHRSLQLTIVNKTHKTLIFSSSYFDSGCSYTDPTTNIKPGQATTWLVANSQGSFLTGVTGGMKFLIRGSNKLALFIGFCNPAIGSYKHYGAVEQEDLGARMGYDKCENDDIKYCNQNGFLVTVQKQESEVAHRQIVYTIAKSN